MGTTAQKLEYLGTTKSQLKDMINYGLDENKITSSTTFRNYVSSIKEAFLEALRTPDTLFTNLPKKSASGSNISLTGVANAPMRITLSPSELTQASTPTPSSPQEVHTISGDNTILVRGKNLFDGIMEEGAYDNSNGNKTTNSSMRRNVNIIPVEPSTTYRISNNGTGVAMNVMQYRKNKTFISASVPSATSSFTTTENTYYINIYRGSTNVDKLQIEVGSTATTYEPYISQEADIDLGVKNLFDIKTNNLYRGVVTSNGFFANTTAICCQKFIEVEPGETYTVSFDTTTTANINRVNFSFFVSNAFNRDSETGWITPFTATIPSNCHYILLSFKNNNTGTVDISDISNIQLEKGSVAHSYSEYGVEPINYSKISTYEDKFIRTSGKNLLPVTNQDYTINSVRFRAENGSIKINGTASANITGFLVRTDAYFPITLEAGTYYFKRNLTNLSVGLIKADSDNATVSLSGSSTATSTTFTLNEKTKLYLFFYIASGTTISNQDWQIMVSKTNDDYEPYGNGTWYIKKNIGKVVLDGTENWTYTSNSSYPFRLTFTNANFTTSSNISPNVLCNYYSPFAWNIGTKPNYGTTATVDNPQIITFRNIDITSKADWLTWLGNNNTTLYYVLQTPTYTQITGTLETQLENVYQKMLSYSGTTNISQINNDLPFIMNVSAIEV